MIGEMLRGLSVWQIFAHSLEWKERQLVYNRAYRAALDRRKPLVVVGGTKGRHGSGDLCIDLNAKSCRGAPVTMIADIRDIPLPAKWAGAVFASHVLEHLPTIRDAKLAVKELDRIADVVFIVSPHRWNPNAWVHPDHHLWVNQRGHTVEFRRMRK